MRCFQGHTFQIPSSSQMWNLQSLSCSSLWLTNHLLHRDREWSTHICSFWHTHHAQLHTSRILPLLGSHQSYYPSPWSLFNAIPYAICIPSSHCLISKKQMVCDTYTSPSKETFRNAHFTSIWHMDQLFILAKAITNLIVSILATSVKIISKSISCLWKNPLSTSLVVCLVTSITP